MTQEQKPLEVLVIDDEEMIRDLLKDLIRGTGANVTTAVDGREGIDKYVRMLESGTPYDLVFTDLMMPKATGVDVTRAVKEKSPNTPIYVITGREATREYESLRANLGELAPDGVVAKPFKINQIRSIVEEVRIQKYGPGDPSTYEPPTPQL